MQVWRSTSLPSGVNSGIVTGGCQCQVPRWAPTTYISTNEWRGCITSVATPESDSLQTYSVCILPIQVTIQVLLNLAGNTSGENLCAFCGSLGAGEITYDCMLNCEISNVQRFSPRYLHLLRKHWLEHFPLICTNGRDEDDSKSKG